MPNLTAASSSIASDFAVIGKLAQVDWDFPKRVTHSGIEGLHPYPAKFVAELPRALLNILPIPAGTAVLDPFCGSGTTLVESQRHGLASVGIDVNPIACLMSRVKTEPVHPTSQRPPGASSTGRKKSAIQPFQPFRTSITGFSGRYRKHSLR